eukprot:6181180-Pleurochrysis_carterae.AAC.2
MCQRNNGCMICRHLSAWPVRVISDFTFLKDLSAQKYGKQATSSDVLGCFRKAMRIGQDSGDFAYLTKLEVDQNFDDFACLTKLPVDEKYVFLFWLHFRILPENHGCIFGFFLKTLKIGLFYQFR